MSKFYLFPNGYVFKVLSFIDINFKIILLGIFVLIMSYPSYRYFYEKYLEQELLFVQQQLTEEITQKKILYQSLSKYNDDFNRKEQSISKLNQQLQNLFTLYQVNLEQMQWNLEQEKSIYFSLNHQVRMVFKLMREISKFKQLKFKEIHLIKLTSGKQLQLNSTVVVIEDENE